MLKIEICETILMLKTKVFWDLVMAPGTLVRTGALLDPELDVISQDETAKPATGFPLGLVHNLKDLASVLEVYYQVLGLKPLGLAPGLRSREMSPFSGFQSLLTSDLQYRLYYMCQVSCSFVVGSYSPPCVLWFS